MAENLQPSEVVTRRSAANALMVVGFAYVSAFVTFAVAARYEHEWGQLGMAILAYACVPPAVLFFITQAIVRRGKAVGWAILLTVVSGGLLTLMVVLGLFSFLSQLGQMISTDDMDTWRIPWGRGEVVIWMTDAVLLSIHVRAFLRIGRWSACPKTASPATAPPPDFSWATGNQPLTDQVDSECPPNSQAGEASAAPRRPQAAD